ncbi:MAG: polyphosphate kinase 1 [Thermoanaerobaculia bacterium]|nr:polyphosphate kinase 1 [Thermoanaerobaculia bacterium]
MSETAATSGNTVTQTSPQPAEGTAVAARPARPPRQDLENPSLYFNRELSWLEFNRRVLEEALDTRHPLLERVKFLAIFSSNLDEFFMIRVSGLRRQLQAEVVKRPPDGMTPAEQLAGLQEQLVPMLEIAARCWSEDLMPALAAHDIHILSYDQLKKKQRKLLRKLFKREIFPALTPLAFDPSHPFPHISNLSINLAVVVRHEDHGDRFARLKVPQVFPRLLRIPTEDKAELYEDLGLEDLSNNHFVRLEEVVSANLDMLFPGLEVLASHPFRVTRDADFEIEEDEAGDLLEAMEEVVGQRHFGFAVRLEVDSLIPDHIKDILVRNLSLAPSQAFAMEGPIGKSDFMELMKIDRPDLKDTPFLPHTHSALATRENLFESIKQRSVLVYHPYDSFHPVVDFIRAAARDPRVLTIKQTLYRVGPDSPVVKALMEARENGKQVAVLVELKARFDETNNIVWARALERAGVHVVYGVLGLKTHAKMTMVIRREVGGIKRYVHLGTGNYNPVTARIYTDLGFFTCDDDLAADVSDLFNGLTGYSKKDEYRKILVAPRSMRREILRRIDREISQHERDGGGGHIAFKSNALVDQACIQALYRASRAGVRVDLQIRGICCLRPGVEHVSENITVTSIVGRFLEHSRILYFRNGGDEEIFLGSADLMPRNLNGRVEVLFPIDDEGIRNSLRDEILFTHLRDTRNARKLLTDGSFERVMPEEGQEPLDSQAHMLERQRRWVLE